MGLLLLSSPSTCPCIFQLNPSWNEPSNNDILDVSLEGVLSSLQGWKGCLSRH